MKPFEHLPLDLQNDLQRAWASGEGPVTLEARFDDGRGNNPVTLYFPDEIPMARLWVYLPEYCENFAEPFPSRDVYYGVDCIDLLKIVPSYDAAGVLCWIPALRRFGTYDSSHCVLYSFPDASWNMIRKSSARYVNAQWFPDRVDHELVRPWRDIALQDSPQLTDPWSDSDED